MRGRFAGDDAHPEDDLRARGDVAGGHVTGRGAAAGTWDGTWKSDVYSGLTGTFEMTFTQSGDSLSGPITVEHATCITTGTITGTLAGSTIQFGAVHASTTITYTGALSGDSMSGTHDSAKCGQDKGTCTASRMG